MKKSVLMAVAIAAAGGVCAESEGRWYINPMVGYQWVDSDRALDDDKLLGLGLEYQYNERWGTEIKYLQGGFDAKNGSNDADVKHLILEGMYHLRGSEKFSPYLAAGLGHAEYDYDVSDKADGTTALIGPGFRYWLNDRWSTKFDVRYVHGLDESDNDTLATLALSYALGTMSSSVPAAVSAPSSIDADADMDGIVDSIDQCPSTPKGVKVDATGCELDSDGDGVVDRLDQCPQTAAGAKVDSQGCAEKLTRQESIELDVKFASGSDQIAEGSMAEIKKVAQFMRSYATVTGVIEGHTDNTGSAGFNQSLSQRRAEAVRSVLVNQYGIAADRLTAKGYGEDRPIATNETSAGRQQNRRVVAVFEAQVTE